MYDRILFPTDGSEGAARVYEHVLDVAARNDATVRVLHVADTTRDSVVRVGGEVVDTLETEGEEIVEAAAERAEERGVSVITDVVQGRPHEEILSYAAGHEVDLIVMPTHGREGLERFLLGSVTERVIRRADVPVLTVRPDDGEVEYPYRDVLVPTDGSGGAAAALDIGIEVATTHDATLHLLSVVDAGSLGYEVNSELLIDALEEHAAGLVEEAAETARDAGVESVTGTVEFGASIHRGVLGYVDDNGIDLVVAGTHGRTGLDRYLLGSVAEKLVRTSPVPVLTVRGPAAEE